MLPANDDHAIEGKSMTKRASTAGHPIDQSSVGNGGKSEQRWFEQKHIVVID